MSRVDVKLCVCMSGNAYVRMQNIFYMYMYVGDEVKRVSCVIDPFGAS